VEAATKVEAPKAEAAEAATPSAESSTEEK